MSAPKNVEKVTTANAATRFRKGGAPGPGRPKGVPNKLTQDSREALRLAFEGIGGVEALTGWARANPDGFYALWGKTIPKQVESDHAGEVTIRVTYEAPGAADRGDG